ncbi:MAG TPA: PrsW family glutamic-type intramembrane protease [Candidatus Krumholzibacteria bacterium]|nr:PrsW family glutamic-type intramembrane protease [Candidatus Krumholzibacteria bacterium]
MPSSDAIGPAALLLPLVLALVPVQIFLLVLSALDTWRLVRPRRIVVGLVVGAVAAGVSFVVNNTVVALTGLGSAAFAVYVAPLVEETAKGAWTAWQVGSRRIGFLVDALLLGFAVGAGFATVENLYFLHLAPGAPPVVWAIRGVGTAVMHGGAAALFAVVQRMLRDGPRRRWAWPASLVAAWLLHAGFNRLLAWPLPATAALLLLVPAVLAAAHHLGERRLRAWLGRGFDRDAELLAVIRSGEVRATPLGRYLESLRSLARPETVADMLCLLRLQAELAIRAKGTLLLRQEGLEPAPEPELAARLAEVAHLEASIGRAGLLALRPVSPWRGDGRWQRQLLEQEASAGRPAR